jgi:chromate reductase, NAD(P)H dehydrogenase (quinone)
MKTYRVGYFVGSLATASINRKLSKALVAMAPAEFRMREIPIRDLPLYSYDYDSDYPEVARTLKKSIEDSDAVLFVTPEYNRGVPGGLKNAIDWASRPYGKNSFKRKPVAIIGTSPGKIGTAIAQRTLHSIMGYCDAIQMTAPEPYIQFTKDLVDDQGEVKDEKTKEFLGKFMKAFQDFVAAHAEGLRKSA